MKIKPLKVCTHSRSRSGSRESSPTSSIHNKRPMSASLANAVRERCVQPQVVHMTEEKYIEQKREQFKPAMLSDATQVFAGERQLDLRVGEPTFFYIVLENAESRDRTYTVTVSNTNEKVESLVKMLTNMDDIAYWQLYGRLDTQASYQGRQVQYIISENVVEQCILQNEIYVRGRESVAIPFLIRSYKNTGFLKERIQIKATYNQTKPNKKKKDVAVQDTHDEIHRFTITERYQPVVHLQAFESLLIRDQNVRQNTLTLIPNFKTFFSNELRPNYLGEASTALSRFFFKSNLGKVTLTQDQDML